MTEAGYYLGKLLLPLERWLERPDVTDIWINRPCEVWVETLWGTIERHDDTDLNEAMLGRLARQIAAASSQGISRSHPLLAANLPDGSRVQVVGPPATRAGHVFAIRRHVSAQLSLDEWTEAGAFNLMADGNSDEGVRRAFRSIEAAEAPAFLADAVRNRRNILVSGGTSSGKTTLLNSLLGLVPQHERLICIEDTIELQIPIPNMVGLIAARGELSETEVTVEDLLIAALRMRPDRIILGELRGSEAFAFLRAVNSGHPGSMTSIHADTPQRAIEQLALLALQFNSNLSHDVIRRYVRESIDVFVQTERTQGRRYIKTILT